MKVINNAQAARGVWFKGDLVWLKPGEDHEGEMTEAEAKLVDLDDNLKVTGKPAAAKA